MKRTTTKPIEYSFTNDETLLFDPGERDHVIGLIAASKNDPQKYRDDLADTLERLLIAPLDRVTNRLMERGASTDSARAFRDSAEIAISILRMGGEVEADTLLLRWLQFADGIAATWVYHHVPQNSRQNSRNATGTRARFTDGNGEGLSNAAIIRRIAFQKDELGDFLPSNELWDEIPSVLEELGLHPVDKGDSYEFDGGEIHYDSFKVQLSRIRNSPALT